MSSNQDELHDLLSKLQAPIESIEALLAYLAAPLDNIGLLPPVFRKFNTQPLPSGAFKISRHLSQFQRILLQEVVLTWESHLAEKKAALLVDQYFCPDAFSNASSAAGQVSIVAYSTLLSAPKQLSSRYGLRILELLTVQYPVDRIYTAVFDSGMSGLDDQSGELDLGFGFRKEAVGRFVSSHIVSFWEATLPTIQSKIYAVNRQAYFAYWNELLGNLQSTLTLQSILMSLFGSLRKLGSPLDDSSEQRVVVREEAILLTNLVGTAQPDNEELWEIITNLILNRPFSISHARIFVCWLSGAANNGGEINITALDAFLQSVLQLWSDPEHVKHSLLSQHHYVTSLLLLTVSYFNQGSRPMEELTFNTSFIQGVSRYLSHQDSSVRLCGMLVAEEIARMGGKKLAFPGWDGEDSGRSWARNLRRLVEGRDVDADVGDGDLAKPAGDGESTVEGVVGPGSMRATVEEASGMPERVHFTKVAEGYDSDDSLAGYESSPSSRSASPTPSELEEIEKDPTLNVTAKKVARPVYLKQLGDLLRSSGGKTSSDDPHEADKIEMGLNCAEELIRKKRDYGTELAENAVNLEYALLGLNNNYELEGFSEKRQAALNALVACAPRPAAPALIEEFFKNQYSVDQRYVALNALALGARELASLPVPESRVLANKTAFPSRMLPPALHRKYLAAGENRDLLPSLVEDISRKALDSAKSSGMEDHPSLVREKALRIKRPSGISQISRLDNLQTPAPSQRTTFTEVAAEYFIAPLTNRFWLFLREEQAREERTSHLGGRAKYHGAGTGLILNPLVLSHFLRTLAILVNASQNALEWLAIIAPDSLELAITIGTRPMSTADEDEEDGRQGTKEASVICSALELVLVVLDGSLELDGGRSLGLEHTHLLLGANEWASKIFEALEKGVKVEGEGGVHEMRLRSVAAGVLLKADEVISKAHAVQRRFLATTPARRSDALFVHRDTAYNNPKIPFEFNPENMKRAQEIIARYPPQYKKAATIPLLDLGQRQNKGWTSISVMNYVAKLLEMPAMRVYEVATFYTMFNREPIGEHFVQVCTTTPCMLRGSTDILNAACSHLGGIHPGQTTKDGKFTVIEVECQGACSNAPMLVVGDDFYEDLTPESTKKILDAFAKGEKPKPGPQSSRQTSENSAGLTALASKPYGPGEFCQPEFQ
ncbi:hypothetical protein MD484_g2776, partial [Candolleomyces efflorescens]